ncbi:Methyl-CpG-binding domain protein 4 [Ranunculus cassubicifolius]
MTSSERSRGFVTSYTPTKGKGWLSSKSSRSTITTSLYTVQYAECFKWRVIPTQEEYEEIGRNIIEDPWFCNKKTDVTCEDPADIDYDASRIWVMDKPNLPKTPNGFKKKVVVRSDFSTCDIYYDVPTGKRVRSLSEMQRFLNNNPKYKSMVEISDFDFTRPKIMAYTVAVYAEEDASSASKKLKTC